jgi:hypothetical protein
MKERLRVSYSKSGLTGREMKRRACLGMSRRGRVKKKESKTDRVKEKVSQ